ncbi:MAG: prolyl oligopeptidase family serine peptidase [bacterium]|nr:prolyl oligopeptidase family serine peptidase [bacterium]
MGTSVGGQQLSYLLHVPVASDVPPDGWPLLLFLHGAGERGDDLSLVRVHGPPKLTGEIPELSRCVVVAPQCPSDAWWKPETLEALLDEVRALTLPDPTRIYVTGLSMGGYGTWGLLASSPDTFAAAVPICGGGDPCRLWQDRVPAGGFDLDELLRAKDVPIHAFHGASDSVVPADESRMLVRALEAVEASVRLTVYPGVGHDSWTQTYADPALYAWMFAQKRETE